MKPALILAPLLALALAGCGSSEALPTPAAVPKAAAKPAAPPAPRAALPPGHLARADVDAVLPSGPPWILRRVSVEPVLGDDQRFVGWRVLALPKDWSGIDLKPGDVVTRVNGMPIERPEQLWTAWTSLTVASDLRVAYDRDGSQREAVFHIDGEPSKQAPSVLRDDAPPPRNAGSPKSRVVVIPGDDGTGDDGGGE